MGHITFPPPANLFSQRGVHRHLVFSPAGTIQTVTATSGNKNKTGWWQAVGNLNLPMMFSPDIYGWRAKRAHIRGIVAERATMTALMVCIRFSRSFIEDYRACGLEHLFRDPVLLLQAVSHFDFASHFGVLSL